MRFPSTFRLSAIAALLPLFGIAYEASGFGTINLPLSGQNSEHERITRLGLTDFGKDTLSELAGDNGTFGAVGAPDNPARGLMSKAAAHCDGADFLSPPVVPASPAYPQSKAQAQANLEACRSWMSAALEQAVKAAAPLAKPGAISTSLHCAFTGKPGRAKCEVLEQLGLVLHAAQDFYSHSNWVDQPAPSPVSAINPPGLGQPGRAPWLDLRETQAFPDGLITGCYDGFPESAHCEYAGLKRAKHAALNKDTGTIQKSGDPSGSTPRGKVNGNFARAVRAAVDDTQDKWKYFQERVIAVYGTDAGRVIICAVRSDKATRCK
ncbi:MAG: hypothetical protein ABL973_15515 [Micropepsaceae bacterium]